MKINVTRRQRAFFAKWGGVVVATILIIPLSLFGGTFLLANSRIDNTLNYVTQAVNVLNIIPAGPTDDLPPDYVYKLYIYVQNDTPDPAEVSITDATITIEKFGYEITGSAGWSGLVPGKGTSTFEGDITVLREQVREWEDQPVVIKIRGTINVKARYGFVEKEATGLVLINIPDAVFPLPTTVPLPEVPTR